MSDPGTVTLPLRLLLFPERGEKPAVEIVIAPAETGENVVGAIRRPAVAIFGDHVRINPSRIKVIPRRQLRIHVRQVVMDVINAHIQRIILTNRETKIAPQPVALLSYSSRHLHRQHRSCCRNFPAEVDAINGKIGVGCAQFNIGLVAVTGAVKTHAVAGA